MKVANHQVTIDIITMEMETLLMQKMMEMGEEATTGVAMGMETVPRNRMKMEMVEEDTEGTEIATMILIIQIMKIQVPMIHQVVEEDTITATGMEMEITQMTEMEMGRDHTGAITSIIIKRKKILMPSLMNSLKDMKASQINAVVAIEAAITHQSRMEKEGIEDTTITAMTEANTQTKREKMEKKEGDMVMVIDIDMATTRPKQANLMTQKEELKEKMEMKMELELEMGKEGIEEVEIEMIIVIVITVIIIIAMMRITIAVATEAKEGMEEETTRARELVKME